MLAPFCSSVQLFIHQPLSSSIQLSISHPIRPKFFCRSHRTPRQRLCAQAPSWIINLMSHICRCHICNACRQQEEGAANGIVMVSSIERRCQVHRQRNMYVSQIFMTTCMLPSVLINAQNMLARLLQVLYTAPSMHRQIVKVAVHFHNSIPSTYTIGCERVLQAAYTQLQVLTQDVVQRSRPMFASMRRVAEGAVASIIGGLILWRIRS